MGGWKSYGGQFQISEGKAVCGMICRFSLLTFILCVAEEYGIVWRLLLTEQQCPETQDCPDIQMVQS